jgi:hypothetical protein
MRRSWSIVCVATLFAACASQEPTPDTSLDDSAGLVEITVCADGFVRTGDRRIPLEAIVLELRQRMRAMAKEDVHRFVVRLLAEPQPPNSPAAAATQRAIDRLYHELQIMGVKQVRHL